MSSTPTKHGSLTFESATRHVNPFLRNCGNFSLVSHSQSSREDYLKQRQMRMKTHLQRTNLSVLNVGAEKPKGLPDEAWEDDREEDFVQRVIRGEKRHLVSKFVLSKRTEELFISVKAHADLLRTQLKMTPQIVEEPAEHHQPFSPAVLPSQPLSSPVKQHSQQQSRNSTMLRKDVKIFRGELYRHQGKPATVKNRLPALNPERSSPEKQTIDGTKLNRPLLLYSPKDLAQIKAESYIITEHPSGQVVLAHRSKILLEIASLTKIMTFYTAIKVAETNNINLSERIEVHPWFEDVSGTSAQLVEGDIYTLEQLLYGLMLPSGNDAAMCLADWAGKLLSNKTQIKDTVKTFVQQMNRNAKQLGLKDTRFGNAHGLPHNDSRSTASDVAKLVSICMGMPLFREIVNTKEYKNKIMTNYGQQRVVEWENTNKLLRRPGFIGVKTGITVTAGPCLATCYVFRGRTFIVVLLRTNKVSRRFKQTRKILSWALKSLFEVTPEEKETLDALRRNRRDFDSDNSEDQQEFVYSKCSSHELAKRQKILKYEL